jgi:trk system potassium uptake protein TrkA
MRHFLLVGLGAFGRAVAEGLMAAGAEVIGVDENMELVEAIRDRLSVAAQVDGMDPDALRAVGADKVDAAVVAIGGDFEAEVLTVAILKELEVPEIVARARNDRERRILGLVGATRVLQVEVEMGERLARTLAMATVQDSVEIADGIGLITVAADERVLGKRLAETELRPRWGLDLVAVRRPRPGGKEAVTVMPDPEFAFQAGDSLLLVGADARIRAYVAEGR